MGALWLDGMDSSGENLSRTRRSVLLPNWKLDEQSPLIVAAKQSVAAWVEGFAGKVMSEVQE